MIQIVFLKRQIPQVAPKTLFSKYSPEQFLNHLILIHIKKFLQKSKKGQNKSFLNPLVLVSLGWKNHL